ncbi:hypothetical protein K502DRAFT_237277 [Neoconidiobolus thromboides FSU 785]|nr:hypothetical protein K502DRAFT_237277 [Neoconidiobolus thromboides FSU 785]
MNFAFLFFYLLFICKMTTETNNSELNFPKYKLAGDPEGDNYLEREGGNIPEDYYKTFNKLSDIFNQAKGDGISAWKKFVLEEGKEVSKEKLEEFANKQRNPKAIKELHHLLVEELDIKIEKQSKEEREKEEKAEQEAGDNFGFFFDPNFQAMALYDQCDQLIKNKFNVNDDE